MLLKTLTLLSGVGPDLADGVSKIAPGVMLTLGADGFTFSFRSPASVHSESWKSFSSSDNLPLSSSSSRKPSNNFLLKVEFERLFDSSPENVNGNHS